MGRKVGALMKFTKGPWIIGDVSTEAHGIDTAIFVEIKSEEILLANALLEGPYIDDVQDLSEGYANARLIAAAPEMLKALEHIQNELCPSEYVKHSKDAIQLVNDAIKKAKGEL